MIAKVEGGEAGVGKGVTVKDRDERLKRLREKMTELVEEEELAAGKAAKKTAKGGVAGEGGRNQKLLIIECESLVPLHQT
jgi:nucleolar protein 4